MSDQADDRTGCSRCRELEEQILQIRASVPGPDAMGLWPFQGSDVDDECVFCARKMHEVDDRDGRIIGQTDEEFCDGRWRWRRWWRLWLHCPDVPHLHRKCESCGASWLQKTRPATAPPSGAL